MFSVYWFRHWNKIFWLLFAVVSSWLIVSILTSSISFELFALLGFLVIVVGAGKLSDELTDMKIIGYQEDIYKKLTSISQQLEKTFDLASRHKSRTEYRVHKLEKRRIDTDIKLEKRYRELVSKIIEIENKVNKLSKVMKK